MNVFMRAVRRSANRGYSADGEDQLKLECENNTLFSEWKRQYFPDNTQKCPWFAVAITPHTEVAESLTQQWHST
jgi:hypothetical protein